jgi:hypothetical protein
MLADTSVASLEGRSLEAGDFDDLLAPDVERDVLRWMNDAKGTLALWSKEMWAAFRSQSKAKLKFDPRAEGALGAAERMAARRGDWKQVWSRFAESPRSYPGIVALLESAAPHQLGLDDHAYWPRVNEKQEDELRTGLTDLAQIGKIEAARKVGEFETRHGPRRGWVWAQLDRCPLAVSLEHLAVMVDVCARALGGATAEGMAQSYAEAGWRADDAVLRALTSVERGPDVEAIKSAVRAIYEPWMDEAAKHLQGLTKKSGYTGHEPANQATLTPAAGECVLFVDGLRLDLGHRLRGRLDTRGLRATLSCRWSALPSVTPTGKTAVSPVAGLLGGGGEDFNPAVAETGELLTTDRFRKLLEKVGVEHLPREEIGNPATRGWTEFGDVDTVGHEQGWKLARRVDEQLGEVVERIESLLKAGWTRVKVVTDHGWLLLPGGLPKAELPIYLADSRWGRCASLKEGAGDGDQLVVGWRWSPSVRIALAPGICCFRAGLEYTHGGLSLQECVTPMLDVTRGTIAQAGTIIEVTWTGLRCRVRVTGAPAGAVVEVRSRPADPTTTKSNGAKVVDQQGNVSLVIPDDSLLGTAAVVVLVGDGGVLLAKYPTCIGGED